MNIFKIYIAIFLTIMSMGAYSQSRMLSGHVVDGETNLPVSGATVHSRELKIAVGSTDNNGRFSVSVNNNTKALIVKLMGYKDYVFQIDGRTNNVQIVLESAKNAMDEVVVVGYTQRSRETLTGSNVIISGKDIQDLPAGNVMELLQGRVPGLNIQNNNGAPGMRGAVTVRGVSTLNVSGGGNNAFLTPTSPLYIVDGVPIDDDSYSYGFESASPGISPISLIPTEDIQQIEVLKDASATSLYGSRGAYGVIIITTKRGQSKIPIVQYTSNAFMNTPPRLRDIIGGQGERRMRIDQLINFDTSYNQWLSHEYIDQTAFLSDSLNPYYNNNTNWQSIFYRTTYNQSHNVNISGGDINFNYKLNAGLYDEKGIVRNTGFTRYSLQMNGQYMPSNKFKMISAISTNVGKNSEGSGNALRQSGVADGANTSSLLPSPSMYTASNSVLSAFNVQSVNKSTNIKTNLELQYEPLEGLRAVSTVSYDYMVSTKDKFTPSSLNNNSSLYDAYNDNKRTFYNRNMISYVKQLGEGTHNFSANIFNELNMTSFGADHIRNIGTANDLVLGPIGLNYDASKGGTLDNLSEVRSVAFAGSASYNYVQKYVVDFNYRIDGTSSNGPLNPYKVNPSAGLRWNFNKESFMEDVSWLDYGSLRLSWGRNIDPNGNIFDIYGRYVTFGERYNNQIATGLNKSVAPNLSLEPLSNTQWNLGVEASFMDGRFSFSYDTYYKESLGIMDKIDIADIAAFEKVTTNEKALVNYGHELSVTVRPLVPESDFKWTLTGNAAYNKDVTSRLPAGMRQWVIDGGDTKQAILNRLGRNAFSNLLLHYRGVYATDEDVPINPVNGLRMRTASGHFFQAGDPIWTDLNGDYIIDENDYVVIGNSQPLLTGGISSHLQYKAWTLNINTSFTLIRDVLNNANADLLRAYSNPANSDRPNKPKYDDNQGDIKALVPISAFDFWTYYGDSGAGYPNPFDYLRYGSVQPFRYDQTLWMEDGSYVKINQITLSYNINRSFSQRYGISSMRIYGTMGNVYNFNRYSGPDPEIVSSAGRDSSGGYPNKRNFTFGLNVQF